MGAYISDAAKAIAALENETKELFKVSESIASQVETLNIRFIKEMQALSMKHKDVLEKIVAHEEAIGKLLHHGCVQYCA